MFCYVFKVLEPADHFQLFSLIFFSLFFFFLKRATGNLENVPSYEIVWNTLTLKEPGAESAPLRHFLLYLSRLLFFRAETLWLVFFRPCARFNTIFVKIGPRIMTRRCVIERWVQRKTDQNLTDFQWKLHTNRVFFVFRIHFHYVLSYLFGLFGVRTCVSILWHTSLPKNATFCLKKIAKNHDFGDFWWFSCFWHDVTYDVTVASYKVCLYFFWYQWTREGHSYPLVPHTWCFVNRFPRSWGRNPPPPPAVRWVQKARLF